MPCRKQDYLLLEQSVTVDSAEVDALVTRIGEALQLHGSAQTSVSVSRLHGLAGGPGTKPAAGGAGAPAQARTSCCMRLRSRRGSRAAGRPSPYGVPSSGDSDWDRIRPWNRKRLGGPEDDPHRLLQELLLSGNLIKEAVRRLQLSPSSVDLL
uniref:Glycogen synthase kinase binding protein n=1 Tax=Oreochromis niloticus TaxID=8128 RepID=A0A669EEE2_ORENI